MKTRLLGVALGAILLAACGERYEPNPPTEQDVKDAIEPVWINHPDTGVPIPCVYFASADEDDSKAYGFAGLSCDWEYSPTDD